jgi:hypothetical protein
MSRLAQLSPLLDVLVDEYVDRLLRAQHVGDGAQGQTVENLSNREQQDAKPAELRPLSTF